MFAPLSWIFRKIARRYDRSAVFARPDVGKDIRPPPPERPLRWLAGSPFSAEGSPENILRRRIHRVVLAALYLFFLWVLYESYWAWGIFD